MKNLSKGSLSPKTTISNTLEAAFFSSLTELGQDLASTIHGTTGATDRHSQNVDSITQQ